MRTGLAVPAFVPLACLMTASPTPAAPGLRLALSVGDESPTSGAPIVLALTATNDGDAPLVLDFPDGQRYDFEVFTKDGASAWRWSEGMFFTQMLGRETLDPGASLSWTERIDNGLSAGVYRVVATLTTVDPQSVEATLTVAP